MKFYFFVNFYFRFSFFKIYILTELRFKIKISHCFFNGFRHFRAMKF